MRINVGSTNQVKIDAVSEIAAEYAVWSGAEVKSVPVEVELFGHPKTLAETVEGAIERAKKSFVDCDYSIGLESGIMPVPHAKTNYMEFTACAIYDGKNMHLGLSPAFEWPKKIIELILKGLDGSQAFKEAGFTNHPKIGVAEGAIWHLTKGRMNRKEYTKLALEMAMVHLEHPQHFT